MDEFSIAAQGRSAASRLLASGCQCGYQGGSEAEIRNVRVNPDATAAGRRRAEQFGRIAQGPDGALRLDLACLQIGRIVEPGLDAAAALARLQQLADEVVEARRGDDATTAGVEALCEVLFRRHKLRGDTETYYEPSNCCLHRALATEQGMPITLAVIMLEVGRRAGISLQGVGAPFHFLVKYEDAGGERYLDPFHGGRAIERDQLAARLRQTNPAAGASAEAFLSGVTKRQILQRILTNLKGACVRKRQFNEALETTEYLLALAPWALEERRDRGLLHFELREWRQALEDLEAYREHSPDAPDAQRVETIAARARAQLGEHGESGAAV